MTFRNGNKLERIGKYCFAESGIETLAIPKALETIGANAFEGCGDLRIVLVEGGCRASLSAAGVPASANVLFR